MWLNTHVWSTLIYSSNLAVHILIIQPHVLVIFYKVEGEKPPGETWWRQVYESKNHSIKNESNPLLYLLPVKAIQRAYLVASLRQCEATSRPQVTVREMMPMMMKNRVVTHSGGSRGGIQVRSRPWMVWHCRTRPTVSAPVERGQVLVRFLLIYS